MQILIGYYQAFQSGISTALYTRIYNSHTIKKVGGEKLKKNKIKGIHHTSSPPLNFRPTAISDLHQLFIFVLFEGIKLGYRLRQLFWAERRGQDRLSGRALRPQVHVAAVKPRSSRSDV